MILDTFSICVTIVVLNIHFRSPQTHTMAPWIRRVFIHILPRLLVMKRPGAHKQMFSRHGSQQGKYYNSKSCNGVSLPEINYDAIKREIIPILQHSVSEDQDHTRHNGALARGFLDSKRHNGMSFETSSCKLHGDLNYNPSFSPLMDEVNIFEGADGQICPELIRAVEGVRYIAEITRRAEDSNKVKEDWKYVAMVLDRLFLWIFTIAVVVGTAGIILQAPTLYDTRPAIDEQYSEIITPFKKFA